MSRQLGANLTVILNFWLASDFLKTKMSDSDFEDFEEDKGKYLNCLTATASFPFSSRYFRIFNKAWNIQQGNQGSNVAAQEIAVCS